MCIRDSSISSSLKRERFPIRTIQIDESDKKHVLDAILGKIPKNSRILINAFVSPKEWKDRICLLYTSPSPRDRSVSRMPSSA